MCEKCAATYADEGEEPQCIEGSCPVDPDQLPEAALRILEVRSLLVGLAETGLGAQISKEYDLNRDDLLLLAWIEEQLRKLQPQKKPEA